MAHQQRSLDQRLLRDFFVHLLHFHMPAGQLINIVRFMPENNRKLPPEARKMALQLFEQLFTEDDDE